MKINIKKMIVSSGDKSIKVQLDVKTFITLSRISSLEVWLKRYPDAKVIG